MDELDILGAEGITGQYVVLRVKGIDKPKLGRALGGAKGAVIPAALAVADYAPQQALNIAMPLVQKKVHDKYGVDLEYQVTEAPPLAPASKGRPARAVLVGAALGAGGFWAVSRFGVRSLIGKILGRKEGATT